MPERWTGEVMMELHLHRITCKELADEMGIYAKYLSAILNGKKNPKGAEERVKTALQRIIERKEGYDSEADGCYPGTAAEN